MDYIGIVITGTSGAGKSTLAGKICETNKIIMRVPAVTTRDPRLDDEKGSYKYVSLEYFKKLVSSDELLVSWTYRSKFYGIKSQDLHCILSENKIPLLIVSPEGASNLCTTNKKYNFFSIFLDANDKILSQRLSYRSKGEFTTEEMNQIILHRNNDRSYKNKFLYLIENNDVDFSDLLELVTGLWEYKNIDEPLSKRLSSLMIKCGMLLLDANVNNLSDGFYVLRLKDTYIKQNKITEFSSREPFLTIEPGKYVIVLAAETACFPKDIAARIELSLGLYYKGIIEIKELKIDPGYKGNLCCYLFNASNIPVQLRRGSNYATIKFIKLLQLDDNYSDDSLPRAEKVSSSSCNINGFSFLRV